MAGLLRLACAFGLGTTLAFAPARFVVGDDAKGISFVKENTSLADVLSQAKQEGKSVFIDFRSAGCPFCKRLTQDVFSQPAVGDLMKGFVSVSFDVDKGEGKDLAQRYFVQGVPTMVIVDANGTELDRLEGFRSPDEFKKEIERIQKGENTIPELKKQAASAPEDLKAQMALGRKLTIAAPTEAVAVLETVTNKAKGKDRALEAEALISLARAARNANDEARTSAACTRILTDFADTDYAPEALQALIPAHDPDTALVFLAKVRKDAKSPRVAAFADAVESQVHLHAAAKALRRRAEAAGDDPQVLNEIAWVCFEHKMNLKAAVGWARKAVELSKRDPVILDTLANLLFATGQADEAVTVEQEALQGAKDEGLKLEFGETVAKLKAAAAFRKEHPMAAANQTEPDFGTDEATKGSN